MRFRLIGVIVIAWLAILAAPDAAQAQENFPSRPIRIVIPYSPGSVADVFARIVGQNMQEQWKGSIVVESKSGANGSIAAEEVARAAPDGYTWLLVTTFFVASPALTTSLRWDPVRDFVPVGQVCRAPNFFIVPTTLPVKNVAEYVALAKAKPGTLNYSHPGKGSTGHLGFELFKRLAGIDVTGIGYRGYPQMVPDIASGLINSTFLSANQALAQVQTGSIRIIGAISDGRSKYFPDVPTMAEQGFAEAQVTPWFGVVVPAGHTAADRRAHQQGTGDGIGDAGRSAEARCGRLRGQERAAADIRRHHQVRRRAVGQGRQGGGHHRGLTRQAQSTAARFCVRNPAPMLVITAARCVAVRRHQFHDKKFEMRIPIVVICLGLASGAAIGAEFQVHQSNRLFVPSRLIVGMGSVVRFANDEKFVHHAFVDTPQFKADTGDIPPGERRNIVFSQPGLYTVRCAIHPQMKMTVEVSEWE